MFKISLLSHGYIFLAKGTVKAFVPDLKHEGEVYGFLESLQGKVVPVCLGSTKLKYRYYLTVGVKISYMLFLAWGGNEIPADKSTRDPDVRKTILAVRQAGIDQGDISRHNLLWKEETQRVMMIDFERAVKLATVQESSEQTKHRTVLTEQSPNKSRRHIAEDVFHPHSPKRTRLSRQKEYDGLYLE